MSFCSLVAVSLDHYHDFPTSSFVRICRCPFLVKREARSEYVAQIAKMILMVIGELLLKWWKKIKHALQELVICVCREHEDQLGGTCVCDSEKKFRNFSKGHFRCLCFRYSCLYLVTTCMSECVLVLVFKSAWSLHSVMRETWRY